MVQISVIVPMYDTEQFQEKCLQSIADSTFRDIEVLCIDDCSPDRCFEIAQRFSERDPRFRVIRLEKNRGLAGARNVGIEAARGEYIASVDSDDWISPTMFERLFEAADGGRYDIVECGFVHPDFDGIVRHRYSPDEHEFSPDDVAVNIFTDLKPAFWNKLWKRSLFSETGIRFPEGVYFEDMATTPRLVASAKRVRVISDILYYYLKRDGSMTYSVSERHASDCIKCLGVLETHMQANGSMEKHFGHFLELVYRNINNRSTIMRKSDCSQAEKRAHLNMLQSMKREYLSKFQSWPQLKEQQQELLSTSQRFLESGDLQDARKAADLATDLFPDDPAATLLLARVYREIGNEKKRSGLLGAYLRKFGENADIRRAYSQTS